MNLKRYEEFKKRRSARGQLLGRQTEEWVAGLLEQAVEDGRLMGVEHHEQGTPKIDFTVWKLVGGKVERRSFGVTISQRKYKYRKNGGTPEFCFPPGTKPETVFRRVLELFD
ncbi:MAG TPA: hypothetical protein VD862_01545 [Candidatus Paceibacterota bacterium]|nr:hypothetical protein [Candidatus Paceibacterota bacterium]